MSVFCSVPILASLLSCGSPTPLAVGYVEGEFVRLAPIETAHVQTVAVRRGDRVEPGQIIVRLEDTDVRIAVAQAEAALAQAEAQLADLKIGKRPEEIDVLAAALNSAEAEHEEAGRVLERTQDLFGRGTATQAQLDTAKTQLQVTAAAIGQAKANLAVANLPARQETIRAAEEAVKQASAALEEAHWRQSKRSLIAPSAGRVDDVIRDPGDIAGPSAPVLSILPDGAVKLKVYVPEPDFSKLKLGGKLTVRCDGCGNGLTATISYVSPDPEFTPPVIYSLETRQKLVYLIEARPDGDTRLKPGQIVDVDLAASE
ncbi:MULTISPECIES: HlyD family secretion protein [Mesorhizobium]|uniref:HlyD family efflux transporter periplasmic adaptor subunit n=1 Tax=Mesorhizobium denitrificans TaxID=2294114 RepID=A0A371XHB8_9HYPH|nr:MULTISPECIES: HlyD family efflux transporter periplasmic adaptor subunit [Mesorhizobium]RFC68620.1 HlyD family efflux transporter periplasmic adaptor subunit [Mesorhizobium denitrificans]